MDDELIKILKKLVNSGEDYYGCEVWSKDKFAQARLAILSLIRDKVEGMRKKDIGEMAIRHEILSVEYSRGFNQALDQVKDIFKEEK